MSTVHHGTFVKKILEFFPVPKYLRMQAIGVSISDDAVRYVELDDEGKGVYLKSFGKESIPIDTIEGGNISKPEALLDALMKIQKRTGARYAIISLPEEKAYLFKTEIPVSSEDDVRQNIEFKIEENVPISADDAVFDFSFIPTSKPSSDGVVPVAVSLVPKDVVESYVAIFESAGMRPVAFHVESHAVAMSVVPKDDMRTYLVVTIDKTKSCLSVVSDGVVRYASTVSIGSIDLVSKGLGGFKTSKDESRSFLANDFKSEIKKVYTYWSSQGDNSAPLKHAKARNIEKVLVCGDGVFEAGVLEQIASGVPTSVEVANVWTNAFSFGDYIPEIVAKDSIEYAGAVGLALDNLV